MLRQLLKVSIAPLLSLPCYHDCLQVRACFRMVQQVVLGRHSDATNVAPVRLDEQMDAIDVVGEMLFLPKGLAAAGAHPRSLVEMDRSIMLLAVFFEEESALTCREFALERPHSPMNTRNVFSAVRPLTEC